MHLEPKQVPAYLKGGYLGQKFKAEPAESVFIPADAGLWSGGSRNTYSAIELATGRAAAVSDNISSPWSVERQNRIVPLRAGFAIVKHSIFRGKDFGLTFFVHPSDITKLLPEPASDDLSATELKALAIVRGLKSSYRAEYYSRAGISAGEVEAIKAKLCKLGYLNKAGAITVAGRNRAEGVNYY